MKYRTRSLWQGASELALVLTTLTLAAGQAEAQAAPVPQAPPPMPEVSSPQPAPQGQWVSTTQYGFTWVPAGATVVDVGGVPSVYLYTPTYGWTWYASPWGWGPFAYGAWMHGPWPYGFRVFEGAQALVRITPEHIFPNCPRYIPNLKSGESSPYVPCPGVERKEPAWKGFDDFRELVPPRRA